MNIQENCQLCVMADEPQTNPGWIIDFESSIAFVSTEQDFKGRSTLVMRGHYEDLLAVPEDEFERTNREMRTLATAIQKVFQPDRINFSNLGNVIPHLHWHIIPRYVGDICWGGPPVRPPNPRVSTDAEIREIADRIRAAL